MTVALFSALGLGFLYFISAIPIAIAAGAPLEAAAGLAWLGYSIGALIIVLLGVPMRAWIAKRLHFSLEPHSQKIHWKIWNRCGLLGTALLAPVTIGPQLAALFLLALGVAPKKIMTAISLGALPWALGFVVAIKLGWHRSCSFL